MMAYWPALYRALHRLAITYVLQSEPHGIVSDLFDRCSGARTEFDGAHQIRLWFPLTLTQPAQLAETLAHEGLHALFGGLAVLGGGPPVKASLQMPTSKAEQFIYHHPVCDRPLGYGRQVRDFYLRDAGIEEATGHAGVDLLVNQMLSVHRWPLRNRLGGD